MWRLFISLYLLISIGLVLINLSSSFIFDKLASNIQNDKFADLQTLSQLTEGYAQLIGNGDLTQTQVQQVLPLPVTVIERDHVGFLPEQKEQLNEGQTVSLFDDDSHLLLYNSINETFLLQTGPVQLTQTSANPKLKNWLLILSYLLLAALILAWSKPLWRDLTTLINMTNQVSDNKAQLSGSVSKHSVLFPMHLALTQMSARISELMTIQKQMIHAVSHDIRTPLARMKFTLAILDSSKGNSEDLQTTKQSLSSDISDIEELIANLLSFGRIESNQIELDRQEVDLSSLLENLVEKLRPLSESSIDCQLQANVSYFCDGHLLERAVQNLIVNADKYGDGQIKVSLVKMPEKLVISIEDNGSGIPPEKAQQVLQPFTRLEKSRNKCSGGFGLGLAIVSRIIQWHHGKLTIRNGELGGAKVTIEFND